MMGAMSLQQLATIVDGAVIGEDRHFSSVCTDTRAIKKGDLFFALKGENFDANDFVAAAKEKGAVAAVVSKKVDELPVVVVEDTAKALGQLAHAQRVEADIPVIAITGSNGKTSVKEMLLAILSQSFDVLATKGNLNNHLGVPLTLLCIEPAHQIAVIEMGASHAGEIAYLCELATPDFSVINNIGEAHLEGFGSVEGIAHAKSEILEGLSKEGVAVLNRNDAWYDVCLEKVGRRKVLSFGWSDQASVWSDRALVKSELVDGEFKTTFTLRYQHQFVDVSLNLVGEHNVLNALAASSLAIAAGVSLTNIASGLADVMPVAGRMEPLAGLNNSLIVNDCYNASPTSFKAALTCVVNLKKQVWLVLGDFAELGEQAKEIHLQMAELIAAEQVKRVYAVGDNMRYLVEQLSSQAMGHQVVARHFKDKLALSDVLKTELKEGSVVLVKGSRSQGLEEVVNQLLNKEGALCC